ncbi:MAG: hypothetical protein NVS4B11_22440 [Ktedonobacteraceae bacterium]
MMEQELEDRLRRASKEQLLLLIQEIATRYPLLRTEVVALLEKGLDLSQHLASLNGEEIAEVDSELDTDISEDWDFGGDELAALHPVPPPVLVPLDREACRQRIADYLVQLKQGKSLQTLASDLNTLLDEAETRAEHHDYRGAMDVYAIVLDERLVERDEKLTSMFDRAIDDIMPILETLLSEASSNILFETSALTPLLTLEMRQEWLGRLFTLWLRRLDAHHIEENVPEIMLNVAWSEDVALLHRLVEGELQKQPVNERSNIVNFTQQYRTRTLDKFLKELPRI